MRLLAALKKEMLELSRDLHALAALFVMPAVFILIMSLALQDTLGPQTAARFSYLVDNRDGGELSRSFIEQFNRHSGFSPAAAAADPMAALEKRRVNFVLVIAPALEDKLAADKTGADALVRVVGDPGLSPSVLALARAQAELALARLGTEQIGGRLGMTAATPRDGRAGSGYLESRGVTRQPTAVQQSVPAWLVFSMFFIVIPLSTIFISERDHGTLQRLRAMGVSAPLFFGGKIAPFFLINQLQAVIMLLVGVYIVPLLGGQALALDGSPAALALLLAATSLAAIGYATLVAVCASSVAQATIIGGVGNILL
ncbi:MAG: ABC transporter permease, partial [Burkholderiales bacterium]